jgi:hypothetical protein
MKQRGLVRDMMATVHASIPPSGGGPGSIYEVVDLPVIILCNAPSLDGPGSAMTGEATVSYSISSLFSCAETVSTSCWGLLRERLLLLVWLIVAILDQIIHRTMAKYTNGFSHTFRHSSSADNGM